MEVDLNPSSTPVEGRHSAPFRMVMPGSGGGSTAASSSSPSPTGVGHQLSDRKRRRSVQLHSEPLSPSNEHDGQGDIEQLDSEGEGGPTKRRQVNAPSGDGAGGHCYQPLGSGYEPNSVMFDTEHGVDSPMHSLTLASPSSSPGHEETGGLSDVDMMDSISPTPLQPASTFIPRQVKHAHSRTSTIPLHPSPLVQSQRFRSSSSNQSPSSADNTPSSQSCSSEDSGTKRVASQLVQSRSSSCASSPSQPMRAMSQRSNESLVELARTPSPSPLSVSVAGSSRGEGPRLHPSPGISQSSFSGGKQLLRYTMGYRDDCISCKNKTPGHYGHVLPP